MAQSNRILLALSLLISLFLVVPGALAVDSISAISASGIDLQCPDYYDPVCGADGVTYSNECYARAAGAATWKEGPCGSGCPDPALIDCAPGYTVEKQLDENGCYVYKCVEEVFCLALYDPVCGSNGVTYSNECEAKKAGATVVYEGKCDAHVCPPVAMPLCAPGYVVESYEDDYGCLYYKCVRVNDGDKKIEIPSKFTLSEKSTAYVTNYQDMTITLDEIVIGDIVCVTSPCPGSERYVIVTATTPGGCGADADPRCLGPPASSQRLTILEGESASVLGTVLTVVDLGEKEAYLALEFEPVACTLDAKICPDGTAVGRVAPDCEFEKCPAAVCPPVAYPLCAPGYVAEKYEDENGCGYYKCVRSVIYCEDYPYNADCVCEKGERVLDYVEPECPSGELCPALAVRPRFICATRPDLLKVALGQEFKLSTEQAAVIYDYNYLHVRLTKVYDERGLVARLEVTLPGSLRLLEADYLEQDDDAAITGRVAGGFLSSTNAATVDTTEIKSSTSGATDASGSDAFTSSVAPSAYSIVELREGESAEVFGVEISSLELGRGAGVFVVEKRQAISCPEYQKCDDGSITRCYGKDRQCICESCDDVINPVCKPSRCPDGQSVECKNTDNGCVCGACPIPYEPICGNGICEEGEARICRSLDGSTSIAPGEEICYLGCPKDCQIDDDCDGCLANGRCLPYSTRRYVEETAVFCGLDGLWEKQLEDGSSCQNDEECLTNSCSSGTCIDLQAQLEENRNLMRKIIDWFGGWFGRGR